MLFNKNDHGHNTFQASPTEDGWEFRIAEPRGTYYPVHLSAEDAWRLVELIQDVEAVRRSQDKAAPSTTPTWRWWCCKADYPRHAPGCINATSAEEPR